MFSQPRPSLVIIALGVAVVAPAVACGSDPSSSTSGSGESGDDTTWPASDGPQRLLGVQTWHVDGTVADGELFGLGATTDPAVKILRVHAHVQQGKDGSLAIDVDAPAAWKFEFIPGSLPVVSGDAPPAIAFALAQSALDAPKSAAEGVMGSGVLTPQTNSKQSGTLLSGGDGAGCLIRGGAQVIDRLTAVTYQAEAGRAFAALQNFGQCRQADGTVPDPKTEATNHANCVKAVNNAECNADALYAAAATPPMPTSTGQQVQCAYYVTKVLGIPGRSRGLTRVVECMTLDACTQKNGTVDGYQCAGAPPSTRSGA